MILPPSDHEFHLRDRVMRSGFAGWVTEACALYAVVRWEDGREEEVEQFDGSVWVDQRGEEATDG